MSRLIYSKAQEVDVAERERTAFEKGAVWSYALNRPEKWVSINMDLIKNRAVQEYPVPVEYRIVTVPEHKNKSGVPLHLRVVDGKLQFSYGTTLVYSTIHWHDVLNHVQECNDAILNDFPVIVKYSADLFLYPTVMPSFPDSE